jgi:predicted RNA binding protein YcfA (HicA-like mRNA interferase family)
MRTVPFLYIAIERNMTLCCAMPMTVRDVVKMLEQDGWQFHDRNGSHRQFKHAFKKGRVTVAGKPQRCGRWHVE